MTKLFTALLATALFWSAPVAAQVKSIRMAQAPMTPALPPAPAPPPSAATPPSLLTAAEITLRAQNLGLAPTVLTEKIGASQNLQDLQTRFEGSGLLKEGELDASLSEDALTLRYAANKIWAEAPEKAKPAVEIDETRVLPALAVSAGGVRYAIHGIAHGDVRPIRERQVRKLVRSLRKDGAALYSEENLPAFYRYNYGAETLDHRVLQGEAISLRDVPEAPTGLAAAAGRAFLSALSWALPSSLPFFNFRFRGLSRAAAKIGHQDMADYFAAIAKNVYGRRWDLKRVVSDQLPMPLKASIQPDVAARSKAMAEIIAKDAAARGLKAVHILTGVNHAAEIAWYLTH